MRIPAGAPPPRRLTSSPPAVHTEQVRREGALHEKPARRELSARRVTSLRRGRLNPDGRVFWIGRRQRLAPVHLQHSRVSAPRLRHLKFQHSSVFCGYRKPVPEAAGKRRRDVIAIVASRRRRGRQMGWRSELWRNFSRGWWYAQNLQSTAALLLSDMFFVVWSGNTAVWSLLSLSEASAFISGSPNLRPSDADVDCLSWQISLNNNNVALSLTMLRVVCLTQTFGILAVLAVKILLVARTCLSIPTHVPLASRALHASELKHTSSIYCRTPDQRCCLWVTGFQQDVVQNGAAAGEH